MAILLSGTKDSREYKTVVNKPIDEDGSMEISQRDALLGSITWWGFHALLLWMGAWHFFTRDLTDGSLFASDLFAGALILATLLSLLRLSVGCHLLRFVALIGILLVGYHVWQGKAEWGNLTDVAIWVYTFYSFGPSSWRHSLYTPLGVFGKLKA
jgi:type IV secretory pathway VirB2 component (pilin)